MTSVIRLLASVLVGITVSTVYSGVNKEYGNCETNGEKFVYAPDSLMVKNVWKYKTRLSVDDYVHANWWPVTDVKPEAPTNMAAHAYGWAKHGYPYTNVVVELVPTEVVTSGVETVIWIPVTNTTVTTRYWIERKYNLIMIPIAKPTPRSFSRLAIYCGLCTTGEWPKVETWLKSKEFNGINCYNAFFLATTIEEDHELFKPLLAEAKALLGWTDEQVNAFLNQCLY